MPYIIIALIAVFLLIRYRKYIIPIICGAVGLIIIMFVISGDLSIGTIFEVAILIGVAYAVVEYLPGFIKQENEKKLNNYLETECEQLGQMYDSTWENKLTQFKESKMFRNYLEIAQDFAVKNQEKYFTNNEDFSWIQVYIDYIDKNGRATIEQLLQIPNNYLNHTHYYWDGYLMFDAIKLFNEMNRFDGYQMIDFEDVQNLEDVAQQFELSVEELPLPYKYNFVLNDDYVKNCRNNDVQTNVDSEEISFDDLESM